MLVGDRLQGDWSNIYFLAPHSQEHSSVPEVPSGPPRVRGLGLSETEESFVDPHRHLVRDPSPTRTNGRHVVGYSRGNKLNVIDAGGNRKNVGRVSECVEWSRVFRSSEVESVDVCLLVSDLPFSPVWFRCLPLSSSGSGLGS